MTVSSEIDSWESFFSELSELRDLQRQQKQQGLNDFTALGSVLSPNDEVRLHTRFIYSLLNPHGKHYQGTRFLELFLESIGWAGWLDIESTVVRKEYCPNGQSDQIDLYITDGEKEIVIENKLNAKDQKRQVLRYLDAIGANSQRKAKNTLFIYLTKGRKRPSKLGLGSAHDDKSLDAKRFLTLSKEKDCHQLLDEKGNPVSRYMNLWYQRQASGTIKSIQSWLDCCIRAIRTNENSSNIVSAINDYQSIIERATREYESNVTTLKDFLDRNISLGKDYHEQAAQIAKELPSIHRSWLQAAMSHHLENMFREHAEKGLVTEIDHDHADQLLPFLTPDYAKRPDSLIYSARSNFFGDGRDRTNKGKFYLLQTAPLKQRAVIALFYGSKRLHVGCLLRRDATDNERAIVGTLAWDKESSSKLRESIFPEALTQSKRMEYEGIHDLANFGSSPQHALLEKLITTLIRKG
ncbi:PD-(D/E)XK nuclease family protein [Marinobacter bryozoorum]|uniref:PDDEXK-like family protein n=1 Tax=Marinobacter bryozoorum TaxID=256324 RepID=UPI002004AE08|nr:PD-(D/E)XK nuclease family protein [Marinobacter bryozoorum]MCK7544970.1 PD-(D/E)XK nuclease family protein [Marinobacter bryozoorum]